MTSDIITRVHLTFYRPRPRLTVQHNINVCYLIRDRVSPRDSRWYRGSRRIWGGELIYIPVKDSHTRINYLWLITHFKNKTVGFGQRPQPLHDCYTRTDTFVRWEMAATCSRCKFVTVALPKRFRNGRFTSETAVWRFQNWNRHLDPEAV